MNLVNPNVTDIPTRVVMFVAGMIVREGWTGEGEREGRERREKEGREEGVEGRKGRYVRRRVGRLGETRRDTSRLSRSHVVR